ncbi:MAG: glutamine-hydrolyzing carbamoyl-phosphate synthase small subunit [Gammaproteobacteria bacterium]
MLNHLAILALEDGTVFQGVSIGIFGQAVGEVVFNTALTGYQEIVSDPSYCQQIVTLTYPHIGNVGTNSQDEESARVYAAGLVIRDLALQYSNPRGQRSLQQYLNEHQVVGIAGIDTRALTRLLREKGAQRGCLMTGPGVSMSGAVEAARNYPGLVGADLARDVSTKTPYRWSQGSAPLLVSHTQPIATTYRVMAFDFGIKRTILRLLVDRGCQVTVVPAQTTAAEALSSKPEGVFLSNGPGDPEPCDYAIKAIREIVQQGLPVFGICLGHQLLGLACGAKTVKMKFGRHGANHPVAVSPDSPVLLDKFLDAAVEVDVDAVCDGESVFIGGIMEHIEQAGVHSGDSACSLPPRSLCSEMQQRLKEQTAELAKALNVVGLMNVQFAIQGEKIYVLEVNPRASRTVPFVSKAIGVPLGADSGRLHGGAQARRTGCDKGAEAEAFFGKGSGIPFRKISGSRSAVRTGDEIHR